MSGRAGIELVIKTLTRMILRLQESWSLLLEWGMVCVCMCVFVYIIL